MEMDKQLQQMALNHFSYIEFNDIIKIYNGYTK